MGRSIEPEVVALACTAGCTGPIADGDPPAEAAPAFNPSPSDTYLIGIAWETGDMWCPDRSTEWANRRPTIAWVSTEGMQPRAIDWLAGRVVFARGRPVDTPYSPFRVDDPEDECKSMAVDYRSPRGVRVERGEHPPLDHFEIEQLQTVAGPRVELDTDALTVRFENTLPVQLHDLVIHVYYEPCHAHGYPGPRRRSSPPTTLGPGETAEHRFPRLFEDTANGGLERGHEHMIFDHRADHLQIVVSGPAEPTVHLDIDPPLEWLGVQIACPPERPWQSPPDPANVQ
jgi:hypothetical protein